MRSRGRRGHSPWKLASASLAMCCGCLIPTTIPARMCGAAAPAEGIPDSLWQRALSVAATGDSIVPGLIDARFEQVDSDDRVERGKVTIARLSIGPDGKIEHTLVREIEYGEDRSDSTEAAREGEGNDEKEKKQQFSMHLGESPFSGGEGVAIDARPTGEHRSIDGRACTGYAFTRTAKRRTMTGTAWLTDSTGVPVEIQFSERPLPKHVKRMSAVAHYTYDRSLGWRMTEMSIEAVGGFLFIKKRFRVETTFSEHWRLNRSDRGTQEPPMTGEHVPPLPGPR